MSVPTWEERFNLQWNSFRNTMRTQLLGAVERSRDPRGAANAVWIERSPVWNNPLSMIGSWLKNFSAANTEAGDAVRRELDTFQFRSEAEASKSSLLDDLPVPLNDPSILIWGATGAVFVGTRLARLPLPISVISGAVTAIVGKQFVTKSGPVSADPFLDEIDALGFRIRAIVKAADGTA